MASIEERALIESILAHLVMNGELVVDLLGGHRDIARATRQALLRATYASL